MKIWIFSYHFPPHATIGGRRWVKFAKAFHRMGHHVTVFSTRAPKGSRSPWDEDLKGLRVLRLPYRYPRILDRVPQTLLEKLHYKLALAFLRLFFKGNVYDRAIAWRKVLMRVVGMVKSHEGLPDVIFANGPPFRVLVYACALKLLYPSIKVVCDFRDPWTWWFNMGYPALSPRDKAVEKELEGVVMALADRVIAPAQAMCQKLRELYPTMADKVTEVPHSFDSEDMPPPSNVERSGPLKFIFFGTIYPDIQADLARLVETVKRADEAASVDIYSFDRLPGLLTHDPLPAKELFRSMRGYDYVILMYPSSVKDHISSKVMEVAALGVPVLLIVESGDVLAFIQAHVPHVHMLQKDVSNELGALVTKRQRVKHATNQAKLATFDVEHLAATLLSHASPS